LPVQLVAEIGINHNGDIDIAKQLIDLCAVFKIDYVKFQKRDPEICVPKDQKNKLKETPWGTMTYLDYKKRIEFGIVEYNEIDNYCKQKKIKWFASVWDIPSAEFMKQFSDIVKIPSAHLTNHKLLRYCRDNFKKVILSTGMSTELEIRKAIIIGKPDVLFHTNSVYPTHIDDLWMWYIRWLQASYPNKEIGFSSHYYGIVPAIASVYLNIDWIEFHVTLNHEMWGSDHLSSVEPSGIIKLAKGVRDLEKSKKGYGPRIILPGEEKKRESLKGK
jgi:N-acetylneuraminate synthase